MPSGDYIFIAAGGDEKAGAEVSHSSAGGEAGSRKFLSDGEGIICDLVTPLHTKNKNSGVRRSFCF